MACTLADVLRRFGTAYLAAHALSNAQARVWRDILSCRTPALGGERLVCDSCGTTQWRYHCCGNRHCPQCQARQRDAWRAQRLLELLPVPYCHLVFTLPHELNALAAMHPRWVYNTLMQCAADTLSEFASNPRWLGGIGAFTLVLHTWTQDLRRHLHVHALMACGALGLDCHGAHQWVAPKRAANFLFPVHALSRVFRAKFLLALTLAQGSGALPRDPASSHALRQRRLLALRRHDWVVYAKSPLAGPASVLEYLSRYTYRSAIGNERLVAIDEQRVRLRVRAEHGGKRTIAIDGQEFIGRFLQHVLPQGFKRIRHYGVLAPGTKAQRLASARALLSVPQPDPAAVEDARAFMRRVATIDIQRCAHCSDGRWLVVEARRPDRAALAALMPSTPSTRCRGPPR